MEQLEERRAEIVSNICEVIDKKISADTARLIKEFLDLYYRSTSPLELYGKSTMDLYGALMSHWQFIFERQPAETKIRIYNPDLEQHGWESPHTIIEIVHDDMPFLIDSLRLALNRLETHIHLIISVGGINFDRDPAGKIQAVRTAQEGMPAEFPIYIEIDQQSSEEKLQEIKQTLIDVMTDVEVVVKDWQPMKQKLQESLNSLLQERDQQAGHDLDLAEVCEFLEWISQDHFTFLGYAHYTYIADSDGKSLKLDESSALGILSTKRHIKERCLEGMSQSAQEVYLSKQRMLLGKTNDFSTVHRPAYTDFVNLKIFDENNNFIGEHRFVGLFTAVAYNASPSVIPIVRQKIERVYQRAGLPDNSHDSRALINILETLPREDLFHASEDDLFLWAMSILHLQERRKIKLLMRRDIFGRYYSCLVFVPRDSFNSILRKKMQDILLNSLGGTSIDFESRFSESILARVHFVVRVDPLKETLVNHEQIEHILINSARSWEDDLEDALHEHFNEETAVKFWHKYQNAFPAGYKETFSARTAVVDIEHIEDLGNDLDKLAMSLYRPVEDTAENFRFKLYRLNKHLALSDVVPILENMGLRLISERPYKINCGTEQEVWINDYRMQYPNSEHVRPDVVKDIFQSSFQAIWNGKTEDDKFNRLVLAAKMPWQDVVILRAYYKYLRQVGIIFSQNYVEDALFENSAIAKLLIQYFYVKFDPKEDNSVERLQSIQKEIEESLDNVASLSEDRIIRYYLGVMQACLRTNYFQVTEDNQAKDYVSLKFASKQVPDLPLPKPLYEIFVYSTETEGVHLRAANVARGGLRWSDRYEDFRTEVLGLMKAQQVKNSVIVPWGAKGGFVVKKTDYGRDREKWLQQGIQSYKQFISGLLDITDNRHKGEIIKPKNVVCWDEDDPYLVVAADKGTATFSDIANKISEEYNFWLGDAFASGGSDGYDHKKMGITARGAWESVKLHFANFGVNVQQQPITVVGIGDMGGDVFGNGMLLSNKIKLVAAFNHIHIFIDPNPDPESSFQERQRLFTAQRSGWDEYNQKLISAGGGVFSRSDKKILISTEMKKLLDIEEDYLVPNELIKKILTAEVDLFWNGGIGTFYKSVTESHTEVGDRVNDYIRVNAKEARVKVIAEGGNLGLTQLARVEYALNGGVVNTDAIDNSAGVNCSDNEVNIKILFADAMQNDDITLKQRNELMTAMSEEVAELVLMNNRRQNSSISVAARKAEENINMHHRLLRELEKNADLDREVEFLPNVDEISNRIVNHQGFTRPEIAVLLAYTKMDLKRKLLSSTLPDDKFVDHILIEYFPIPLREKFLSNIVNHRLRREIVATELSNDLIDEMGINFIHRLHDETGSSSADIVRAYLVAREVFASSELRKEIDALDDSINYDTKLSIYHELNRLIRRGTRWFLRNRRAGIDISLNIKDFKDNVNAVFKILPKVIMGHSREHVRLEEERYLAAGIEQTFAKRAACLGTMFSSLDIVEAAMQHEFAIEEFANIYYIIGARLELGWFRNQIKNQPVSSHWEALARAAFRDDVDRQQRNLAIGILAGHNQVANAASYVESWLKQHNVLLERWEYFIAELKAATPEFTMFAVALRELLDLSHAITHTRKV